MVLSTLLAAALVWVKANVLPLVAGFLSRHVAAPVVAKAKAALAWAHDKVQAVLAWVHSKL